MTREVLPEDSTRVARRILTPQRALPKRRFRRLRRSLLVHQVASVRFVYCSFAETRLVTLCATSRLPNGAVPALSPSMTSALLRAFVRWMAFTYPGWADGSDTVGSLDWNVRSTEFVHRHSGYRLKHFSTTRSG